MTAHFTGTSGTPDSTTSYYMGGQFEVKDGATKKYYSIAGMMVAVNDGTGLQYLVSTSSTQRLTDHLGSTVAVTNQSGTLTSQQRYLPFGAARTIPNSPILGTDFTYTGQRKFAPADGMGGIMDYRARFYSPALGRFLQPDTIIPNPASPQAYNRFSYVVNNPILFNDPTGHTYCGPDNIYCGGLAENDYYTQPAPTNNSDDDDDIITDPDDEDDSCTPSNCEVDCNDPAWGCITHVEGTWADPAVYVSGTLACLATGACLAAGVSALNAGYEALVLRCLMSVICRSVTGMAGGTSSASTYYRYMVNAELDDINNTGLLRGGNPGATYFTTNVYTSASQAQQQLSLTTTPQIGVEFQIVNSPQIYGPTVVEAVPGLTSGGGTQYWSFDPIRVIINSIWELAP